MKRIDSVYLMIIVTALSINTIVSDVWGAPGNNISGDSLHFYDAHGFVVIGKFHDENNYIRLPARYKTIVREQVWDESLSSAGISIRFRTNATSIVIRWSLAQKNYSWNLNPAAQGGVDLYAYEGDRWQYVNTGLPRDTLNEFTLLQKSEPVYREYLLNLPLYNSVESLSIGINDKAVISGPVEKLLVSKKPVVYYGSSIAQGASASRPGLAFTNILSRKLDRSFINLGFSGEGTFDLSVGVAMSEVDAAAYVIDCTPNTKKELIYDRAVQLVKLLKEKKTKTPVLLIEGFYYDNDYFIINGKAGIDDKRKELKRAYDTLTKSGITGLYYKKGNGLIGFDNEGTVDGVHPNDIGMQRFAANMLPVIKEVLKRVNN